MKKLIPSILAGMFIAFGAMASQYATAITGNKLIGAFLFPIGLSMVVVTGAELFTGKCLMVMETINGTKPGSDLIKDLVRFYIGNFVGSLLAAFLADTAGISKAVDVISGATAKCSLGITETIVKGVLCNILVCTAVYMSQKETSAAKKILTVYLPVIIFVLCGFEHSIADMYFLPVAYMTDRTAISIPQITRTITLATVGNIIGGFGIGACFNMMKNK